MIIERITIRRFGGLTDLSLDLREGITVVEGDNESGKSTAMTFCQYVLYGLSRAELARYIPHDGAPIGGSLILSDGQQRWRAERGDAGVQVVDLSTNLRVELPPKMTPGEWFFGVPAEIFRSTVYVSQADGGHLDGPAMQEAVTNLLFSADESVNWQKAQKKLDNARIALLHKNEKGGQIVELEQEIGELSARLTDATASNTQLIALDSSLRKTRQQLEVNTERCERARVAVSWQESTVVLDQFDKLNALRRRHTQLAAEEKRFADAHSLNGFLPDRSWLAAVEQADADLERLAGERRTLEETRQSMIDGEPDREDSRFTIDQMRQMGGKNVILNRANELESKCRTKRIIAFVLCAVFILAISGATAIFLRGMIIPSLICALGGLLSLTIAATLFTYANLHAKELDTFYDSFAAADLDDLRQALDNTIADEGKLRTFDGHMAAFAEKIEGSLEQSEEINRHLTELLAQWGKSTPEEAVEDAGALFAALDRLADEKNACKKELDTLAAQLTPYDESTLRAGYEELTAQYRALYPDKNELNITLAKKELDFHVRARAALDEKRQELEKQQAALRASTEHPGKIADEIGEKEAELADMRQRLAALQLAARELNAAGEGLSQGLTPRLAARAGQLMGRATGGKYSTLGVTPSLEMEITAEDGTWPAEHLSAGTLDLAYISLRLSLADMLFRKNSPPLIFDESFARLDDGRMAAMFALLAEYAASGRQVILLTSQKRDGAEMKKIAPFTHILLEN